MAQIVVRNIEEDVKKQLKQPAAQHGWSMEEEVRQILRNAIRIAEPQAVKLGMRGTFIAGIALSRRAVLATRNIKHFDDLRTPVINPWAD